MNKSDSLVPRHPLQPKTSQEVQQLIGSNENHHQSPSQLAIACGLHGKNKSSKCTYAHMASRTMKDGLVFSLIILFQLSNTGSSASIIAEMKDFIFECFLQGSVPQFLKLHVHNVVDSPGPPGSHKIQI